MATKVDVTKYPTNSAARRADTRKSNQCQRCGTTVAIKDQYTVTRDYDAKVAKKVKNAGTKANAEANSPHFCADCGDARAAQDTYGLETGRITAPGTKTNPKNKGRGSKAQAKTGKKPAPKSGKAKSSAKAAKGKAKAKPKGKAKAASKRKARPSEKAMAKAQEDEEEPF